MILPSILFGAIFTLTTAWFMGRVCLRRLPADWIMALAVGAAAESTIVFLLLAAGIGQGISFILMGAAGLAAYAWRGRGAMQLADPVKVGADRTSRYVFYAVLGFYGALYLINALAPELEPDARGYHLGLTAEYVRLGGFPARVDFFNMLPQGLEMLFVPAFAFGRHSAARLVHCGFLLATVPVMVRTGRRLGLPEAVSLCAALLYFCAPVAGITGTSAYTDAGGVFFTLATFYVLLVWRETRDVRYLAVAGITAGFCYAIKFPGGLVAVLAVAFVIAVERGIRVRQLAMLGGAALMIAAPWMLRAWIKTGNPVAPLFNRVFRNPYFHASLDGNLAAALRSWWGVPLGRVPYELIAGGAFGGMLGPVFFALPLGLLALRKRAGVWCWVAAVLLALPWWWNTGARFLMPALPFFALVLAMALPRPALWVCVVVEATACWPQIFALYHPAYTWRLERIPWRAALRIQPEQDYLASILPPYQVARLVEDHTKPGERIFSLISVPTAYTDREVLEYWHSAEADRLSDSLFTALTPNYQLLELRAEWTAEALNGIRVRMPLAAPTEWQIQEITIMAAGQTVGARPQWQWRAWPNRWELPLAFDGNLATRWRTWEPIRRGMYVEVSFDRAETVSGVVVTTPVADCPAMEYYGATGDKWRRLAAHTEVRQKPMGDIRMAATRLIRGAGFRYILAENSSSGLGVVGAALADHEGEWGVAKTAAAGPAVLFRIRDDVALRKRAGAGRAAMLGGEESGWQSKN